MANNGIIMRLTMRNICSVEFRIFMSYYYILLLHKSLAVNVWAENFSFGKLIKSLYKVG